MTVLMWTFAVAGFYYGAHLQAVPFDTFTACEAARPRVECEAAALGYVGVRTKCIVVRLEDK